MAAKPDENLDALFAAATVDSKKLVKLPSNDELLHIYSLYKIANKEDISKAPTPGMFDIKGKAKLKAWKKYLEEIEEKVTADTTADQIAKQEYINLVQYLKNAYGYDADKVPETVGSS